MKELFLLRGLIKGLVFQIFFPILYYINLKNKGYVLQIQ